LFDEIGSIVWTQARGDATVVKSQPSYCSSVAASIKLTVD
jgi:hypothetical protein